MIFEVNGVDIVPYAAVNGITWKRQIVEGKNSMRTMDRSRFRDLVASPYEWSFKFRALTAEELSELLQLLDPEKVSVTFTDPVSLDYKTDYFYIGDVPAAYLITRDNGTEYWGGLSATFSSQSGDFR